MSQPPAGPLAMWWRRSATRIGTAFGVVVVLTVWGVAINAVVQFGQPAVAAAATAAAGVTAGPRSTEGGPVQDLAAPTQYVSVPPTTDTVPPATTALRSGADSEAGSDPSVPVPSDVAAVPTSIVASEATTDGSASSTTSGTSGTSGTSATAPSSPEVVVDDNAQTAAARYGWGAPTKIDTFDDPALPGWDLYNGPGHEDKGIRSPNAITAQNGVLTISGDAKGTTGGMAWGTGQKYGRWEGRMRAPVGDGTYHAVMLLWPDAENWPVGGEVDFAEISDAARRSVDGFLHYGADNDQVSATIATDATQWHAWAVEWNPAGITYFLDGRPWFQASDAADLPPGPMHLCLQLDWFPAGDGAVTPTQMQVDDVAYYPLSGTGTSPEIPSGPGSTIAPTSTPSTTRAVPTTMPVRRTVPTSSPVTTTTAPPTTRTTTAPPTTVASTTKATHTRKTTEPPTTSVVPRTSKTATPTTTRAASLTTDAAASSTTATSGASSS